MKHFSFLFVSFFIITGTFAQTQISHFVSENSDTKHIVKTIDGKNYLLSFFQNDELGIYEIVSQDSATYLHSRNFQGIYENYNIKIFGNHMVFESFSGLIIYDFINDTFVEKTFDFPVSYIYARYPSSTDFLTGISVKDTSLSYNYIIDFNGNITDTINSQSIYYRNGSNLIIGEYEYTNDKRTYIYQNYRTNTTDSLFSVYNSSNLFCLSDSVMWFQDGDNNLIEYEYATGNKTLFQNVIHYQGSYHYVFKSENKIYLYNYTKDDKTTHIQIFDINTKEKVNEIDLDDISRIKGRHFYLYNDKIVICLNDGFGSIVIIDPETKKHTTYEMYDTPNRIKILEGGKIFNYNSKWHYGYIFEFIDIDSQTCDTLYGNHKIVSRRQDFIKVGNNYIGSFYENSGGNTVFVMNIDSMEYYPADGLDKTNTGFERGSKIAEIDGKVMILADNLYEVNNDTLTKINTKTINPVVTGKYTVQNGKVYYQNYEGDFPNSFFNLYSYDGIELKREMRMKTSWDIVNIRKYFDTGDYIYFTSSHNLYRYNKADSSVLFLDKLRGIIFDSESFIKKDNIIYYINEGLKMIKDNGQPKSIQSSSIYFREYLIEFKDRLFWVAHSGFYEIKGENLETIHLNSNDSEARITIDKAQKNLIYIERKSGVYHYDGSSFNEISDTSNVYEVSRGIGESFVFKSSIDNKYNYYFYDCESKELTEMPSEKIEGRYFDVFVSNGDSILLSKNWSNPKDAMYIYKATNKFQNLELIEEIQDVGKGIKAKFESFGNEGILYTGDIISLMDENMEFHPLGELKGDYRHPEIINKNGDLYFLAIEKTTGRQLYKTTLYSYRPNVTKDFDKKHLQIFPNPVKDIIYFKNINIGKKDVFEIYNIEGKLLVQNKLKTPRINISYLDEGLYIIVVKTGDSILSGKFIKH